MSNSRGLPTYLKVAILIVAVTFLAYAIYWIINGVLWANSLTQIFSLLLSNQLDVLGPIVPSHAVLLIIQESCSVINCCFVLPASAVLGFVAAVFYLKGKTSYFSKLRWALVLTAVFYLLLLPSSIHHLVGVASGWPMVDIGVGLSYMLQALLIAPALLLLAKKLGKPQAKSQIQRWAAIAASLFVFALWFKYIFLWWDTLLPRTPVENIVGWFGAANSIVTLLAAGIVAGFAASAFLSRGTFSRKLWGLALVLVGGFFLINSLVALFVPAYAWFWYLTDFWMLTLPVLGAALLIQQKTNPS
jgi:hypothetical protein